jgi:hypothetical protein
VPRSEGRDLPTTSTFEQRLDLGNAVSFDATIGSDSKTDSVPFPRGPDSIDALGGRLIAIPGPELTIPMIKMVCWTLLAVTQMRESKRSTLSCMKSESREGEG